MATIHENNKRIDKVGMEIADALVTGSGVELIVENSHISIMNITPCQIGLSIAYWMHSNPDDADWLKRFIINECAD